MAPCFVVAPMTRMMSLVLLLLFVLACTIQGFSISMTIQKGGISTSRRSFITSAAVTSSFLATTTASNSNAAYIDANTDLPAVTKKVYLDVKVKDADGGGRLVIGLFGDFMPKTTENFIKLCEGTGDLSYTGTTFYRVISGTSVQGGAAGSSDGGKTGKSAFADGKPFEPDNFDLKHNREGLVSMVRGIGGAADSRFFINLEADAGWADDRYVAVCAVIFLPKL